MASNPVTSVAVMGFFAPEQSIRATWHWPEHYRRKFPTNEFGNDIGDNSRVLTERHGSGFPKDPAISKYYVHTVVAKQYDSVVKHYGRVSEMPCFPGGGGGESTGEISTDSESLLRW